MDYKKHYDALISKAQNRPSPEGYTEKHHILPRCLGGSNAKTNIAILTGREHFVAHLLLRRIHPDKVGLAIAVIRMVNDSRRITNSRKYEWAKKQCHETMSEHHKKVALKRWQDPEYRKRMSEMSKKIWADPAHIEMMKSRNSGEGNPSYGRTRSQQSREKKSKSSGAKAFKAWRAVCIKPSSYKGSGIFEKGEFLGIFQMRVDFAKQFGVSHNLISKCLNKKSPQSGGFIFEFVE